jgi:acyl-CoA thioesterase-2
MPDSGAAARLVDLEQTGQASFRSRCNQRGHGEALFGGQVLCQSLIAASRTASGRTPHSLHGYFLRGGTADLPVDYAVDVLRDGRQFATRQVAASQAGKLIFHMDCSFHDAEPGIDRQFAAPLDVPGPESLVSLSDFVTSNADRLSPAAIEAYTARFPLEVRLLDPDRAFFKLLDEPRRGFWIRMPSASGVHDAVAHLALLAFLSDYWLVGVAVGRDILPTNRRTLSIASIDHAMWFHRPACADEWLLYQTDSPSARLGLGLARGLLFDRTGALVASTAQEAVFRALVQ